MEINISTFMLRQIIQDAAELGSILVLTRTGKLKPYLKKSEAFRLYGRSNVERWVAAGKIAIRKDGNHSAAWRLDRIELETLSRSARLSRYL